MKIGDRVRLSQHGRDMFEWASDADGTITDTYGGLYFDWLVQWDDDEDGDATRHFENELEVIS